MVFFLIKKGKFYFLIKKIKGIQNSRDYNKKIIKNVIKNIMELWNLKDSDLFYENKNISMVLIPLPNILFINGFHLFFFY
jgi:hypothetical protein